MLGTLILIIPVLLIVTVIMLVIRLLSGDHEPGEGIIKSIVGLVPVIVVVGAAIIMITSMANVVEPSYQWNDEDGTLTINKNIAPNDYPWNDYSSDVKNLIIKNGVTNVPSNAFSGLPNLEYLSIPESLDTIGSDAFPTLKDYQNQIINAEEGEYVRAVDGTLYRCDASIFTYSSSNQTITGLTPEASDAARIIVLPSKHNGVGITTIGSNAFKEKTQIAAIYALPDSRITTINGYAFQGCTSLTNLDLPDTVETLKNYSVQGCTSLNEFAFPANLKTIERFAFRGTALNSITLPEGLQTLGPQCFRDCTAAESVYFPSSLSAIESLSFSNCVGVTSIVFGEEFGPTISTDSFGAWTFYSTDGETTLDKYDAANLAGKTFLGSATALIEMAEGQDTLSTIQLQKVQLHMKELQELKKQISTDIYPGDLEPITA